MPFLMPKLSAVSSPSLCEAISSPLTSTVTFMRMKPACSSLSPVGSMRAHHWLKYSWFLRE